MILRFFYFVFYLHFLRKKLEPAAFRSCLIVSLSFTGILNVVYLLLERWGFPNIFKVIGLFNFIINVLMLVIIWNVFAKENKRQLIYDEFIDSTMNTASNRFACWILFAALFLAPMILAVAEKGIH